jgi:hypothetical protein
MHDGRGQPRLGWRVLAILSVLTGFASLSTELYLPAMPAMGRALRVDAGSMVRASRISPVPSP